MLKYNLGVISKKNGDDTVAAEWYRKAADQGFADAQLNLGLMCDEGKGVPMDKFKAYELYHEGCSTRQ